MEVLYTTDTINANLYRDTVRIDYAKLFQFFVCLFIYNLEESNLTVETKASIPAFLQVYDPTISHNCHR